MEAGERPAYKTEQIAIGKYRNMIEMQHNAGRCHYSEYLPRWPKPIIIAIKTPERPLGDHPSLIRSAVKSLSNLCIAADTPRYYLLLRRLRTNFSFYPRSPLESRCMAFDPIRYRARITMDSFKNFGLHKELSHL